MNIYVKSVFVLLMIFAGSVQAANIVEITVDEMGIPFILDDNGHVWGFKDPHALQHPLKLSNLEHIIKIAPYIAVDEMGHVFTWSIDDSKVDTTEGEITEAGYTPPQRFEELNGVTMVAHSMNHFFAVINNQEIVEWIIIRKEMGFGIESYGQIRKVISRAGVKAIAAAPGTMERVVSESAPFGLVALFEDGTVMGWGLTSSGQVVKDANAPSVLLTKSPGAVGIAINNFHTVILTEQGIPQFWGGCDLYGRVRNGHRWVQSSIQGVKGFVNDIVGMALAQDMNIGGPGGWGDDNEVPDIFIKRDGTVWLAYAPIPSSASSFDCSQDKTHENYLQAQQLLAGKSAAVQVATAGGVYLVLDADHKLWTTGISYGKKKLHYVSVNLK